MICQVDDFGEQFAKRVLAELEDKGAAHSLCPVCGRRDWALNHDTIALLNHLGPDIQLGDARGMSAIAIVCKHCGFIRLHSALHLFDSG